MTSNPNPSVRSSDQKDNRLTRSELGDAVGVSLSTIVRLERRGLIKSSSKNKNGWHLYEPSQIEEVRQRLQMRAPKAAGSSPSSASANSAPNAVQYDADVAARVFKELDKRKHPADIVCELVIHPDIVKSIFLAWNELRGGLYIPQPIMNKINGLSLEGSWPSLTAEEMLENLKKTAAAALPQCLRCKKEERMLCKGCAETLYKR